MPMTTASLRPVASAIDASKLLSRYFSCVLVFVALAIPCLAQVPELKGGPMLDCAGLPCVNITVGNGKPMKMLVDTGNAYSMIDVATAKDLGLELKPVTGPDGKPYPNYQLGTLKDVKLGSAKLDDVQVLVTDLHHAMEKGMVPQADGMIAYTAFPNRLLQLDYKHHKVGVSAVLKDEVGCPSFCGTLSTPTFGKKGPPIVVSNGFEVNGKPVLMQIDTLYSGTMLIYPTSVDKLGLGSQASITQTRLFPFTDGGVKMVEGSAAQEGFGNTALKKNATLYFATPAVHTPDGMFDGTVGHELFAGHVLIFDFHNHLFWIA
jgi:Aspartyl protease